MSVVVERILWIFFSIFPKFPRLVEIPHIMMAQTHAGAESTHFGGQNGQNYLHIDFCSWKQHLRGLSGVLQDDTLDSIAESFQMIAEEQKKVTAYLNYIAKMSHSRRESQVPLEKTHRVIGWYS